jgi:hypothetical protein
MVDILDRWLYNRAMMTNKQLADIAKGLALVLTLLGALATALQWDPGNIVLLNAGSLLYLYWSLTVRDWNLVAVNAGLLTIYVIGAIIRLL